MRERKTNIKDKFIQYKDIILYVCFGICTTIINFISYCILSELGLFPKEINTVVNTWIAWLISVVFAYISNKMWVFKSNVKGVYSVLKEMVMFFACRVATGGLDAIIMFVFVDNLNFNNKGTKLVSNFVIIIINYIGSKFIVFKKKEKKNIDTVI